MHIEKVSGAIQIDPLRNPEDPWLCLWAEFYYLAFMSHNYLSWQDHRALLPNNKLFWLISSTDRCLVMQKSAIINVPFQDRIVPRINLGQPSTLVICSSNQSLEDMILIPSDVEKNKYKYFTGRYFDPQVLILQTINFTKYRGRNEYLEAAYQRILQAKQPQESYPDFYQRLKGFYLDLVRGENQ